LVAPTVPSWNQLERFFREAKSAANGATSPSAAAAAFAMGAAYIMTGSVNQACIAQGQVRRAAVRWIGCAVLFIGWNFVPLVSDEFRRVEIGFLLAAGALFSLLYYVYRRPHERAEDVPQPGSPNELEARLAIIDENV
jgi:hypothetical protein